MDEKISWTRAALAATIDHTLLRAVATRDEVRALCEEACRFGFASACVNPCHVPLAAEILRGSGTAVCTVVGFPLGANASSVKAEEARIAAREGAREIDMVINVGLLRSGAADEVEEDIRSVVAASENALVKVILETCYLSNEEKITACALAERAGARFVKTSTGFGTGGATEEDVRLLRRAVGGRLGVKASGGIKTLADALRMLDAGASRIGTSSGAAIVESLASTERA